MNELKDKAVLITGGGRGIGAAIARRFAELGADVALTYVDDEPSAAAVVADLGPRAFAMRADNADVDAVTGAVDRAAATFGRLDVLVNNGGVFPVGSTEDLGTAEFDRAVAVNVRAPYVAARAAIRHLGEGGRIISIGSNVAERLPFPGLALYALTKSALTGMTKGLARELGSRGITVNLVHPGPTDTALNPADGPNAEAIAGLTALGRYGRPGEIADVVAFLAGDGGAYVTGASVHVDGGFTV